MASEGFGLVIRSLLRSLVAVVSTYGHQCRVGIGAGIAQLVERNLAKVEVASSNLVSRSNFYFNVISLLIQVSPLLFFGRALVC